MNDKYLTEKTRDKMESSFSKSRLCKKQQEKDSYKRKNQNQLSSPRRRVANVILPDIE
ncbi:hypothetical protein SAMN05660297_01030 [Natronincola peptidivorans]|uniref:Uncharacterized protein n=1 Tax=Natronincola peptidivorans TaxID=426128 RepID=A0A1I0AR40_9FIRM|nr:hypothetical protein [Natronincola peptidivorans]SES96414.1 hypothetical protein SAMN05660297_01030 [Natronincola peptidivorans]